MNAPFLMWGGVDFGDFDDFDDLRWREGPICPSASFNGASSSFASGSSFGFDRGR